MYSSNNNGVFALRGERSGQNNPPNSLLQDELERLKMHLQQVTKKNQDLEDMLLYTTKELQNERENSRGIVVTLTERLMESREVINKLEMENMRYKKDCILAVELLQCNKSIDQKKFSSTMEKLSEYATRPGVGENNSKTPGRIMDENQIMATRTTEVPHEKKKAIQRPKLSKTSKGKTDQSDINRETNDKTALLQDDVPCKGMNGAEVKQPVTVEHPPSRENDPPVEKDVLSRHDQSSTPNTRSSVKDKSSDKPSSSWRQTKQTRQEDMPLMNEDSIPKAEEDEPLVKNKTLFAEDEKTAQLGKGLFTMDTEAASSTEQESSFQEDSELSVQNEAVMKNEISPVETKASSTDNSQMLGEKTSTANDNSQAMYGISPVEAEGQDEETFNDTSAVDCSTLTTKDGSSEDEYKTTSNDSETQENEKLLGSGEMSDSVPPKKGEPSSDANGPASEIPSTEEHEIPVAVKNGENGASLTEDEKLLVKDPSSTEEIRNKPQVKQDDTSLKEESRTLDDDNISKDKETEDDLIAEEDTPLV